MVWIARAPTAIPTAISVPARRQERELRAALEAGRSVVVDNTNPTREDRAAIMLLAKEYGARVIGYSFDSDIDRCLERNAKREGVACVSTVGFYATVKRFERPSADEGFDELLSSRFTESRFEKPFDPLFRDHMVKAAMALMESLTGLYAYTESDESPSCSRASGTTSIVRWRR